MTKLFSSLYSSMLLQSAWVAGVSGVARVHAGKEGHPPLPGRPQGPRPPRSRACAVRGGVGGEGGGGGGVGVGGGRGRAVGKPRARDCALPACECFRFSISSQKSRFSVPAGFPESTWCGSSRQPPSPPRRLARPRGAAPLAASTVPAARGVPKGLF